MKKLFFMTALILPAFAFTALAQADSASSAAVVKGQTPCAPDDFFCEAERELLNSGLPAPDAPTKNIEIKETTTTTVTLKEEAPVKPASAPVSVSAPAPTSIPVEPAAIAPAPAPNAIPVEPAASVIPAPQSAPNAVSPVASVAPVAPVASVPAPAQVTAPATPAVAPVAAPMPEIALKNGAVVTNIAKDEKVCKTVIEINCTACSECLKKDSCAKATPKKAVKKTKKVVKKSKKVALKKAVWKKPNERPRIAAKPVFEEPKVEPVQEVEFVKPPLPPVVEPPVVVEKEVTLIVIEPPEVPEAEAPRKVSFDEALETALAKVVGGAPLDTRLKALDTVRKYAENDDIYHNRIENVLAHFIRARLGTPANPIYGNDCFTDVEEALFIIGMIHGDGSAVEINFSNLDFGEIKIPAGSFDRINFNNANFKNAVIAGATFNKAKMHKANFMGAYLKNVDFKGADLSAAVLAGTKIEKADFSEANLGCSVFKKAKIEDSIFTKTKASKTLFEYAYVKDSNFVKSDLSNSFFAHSALIADNFSETNLLKADFYQAQLEKVKFSDANFKDMNIRDTDLQDTEGVTIAMMLQSDFDGSTVAPYNINSTLGQVRVKEISYWDCSQKVCAARLTGFEKYLKELLDSSLNILSAKHETAGNRAWALCNIKCVINADKRYTDYAMGEISDFVKKRSPWPARTNRRAEASSPELDVQAALYVIGSRSENALGSRIDLTKTDLRGADFYGANMNGVDFTGSNLAGALIAKAKGMPLNMGGSVVRK